MAGWTVVPNDNTSAWKPVVTPPAPDTRNAIQRGFDNLTTVTPEQDANTPSFLKPIAHFGAGVIQGMGSPLIHPEQTAEGVGHLIRHPQDTAAQAGQMFENDPAKTIGATLGGAGLGATAGELLPAGARLLSEPMQRGGGGLIEHAAGALKSDFAHGADPGRAYLEGGGTPALTMRGLANKAGAVKSNAGQQLGTAYDTATANGVKIPASDLSDAVLAPANKLRAIQNAPGGTGETPLLDAYEEHATPYLSSQPNFSPREAFDFKKNISANTRWNDPTMFDMNSVRQQGVGGVGKLLTDAVPETAPLNRIYQGAGNLADRATLRADTVTPPLTSMVNRGLEGAAGLGLEYATHNPVLAAAPLLMDTVPVKTGAGYLLYQGGRAAGAVPNLGLPGAATGAASPLLLPRETQ